MSNSRSIPPKDVDFNRWQHIFASAIEINRIPWQLDINWLENRFDPARDTWNNIWAVFENPQLRTSLVIAEKNDHRKVYEGLLSKLVSNLKVNTLLTDKDRRAAGIIINDTKPTAVAVPTTFPVASIDTSMKRRITVHFRDSEREKAGKPYGIHGAEIKWVIADNEPKVSELINSSFDTRTPYTLEFDDDQRAKTIWMCLRWENTRGEKGPWGDMVKSVIP